jgi:hypothetical protein
MNETMTENFFDVCITYDFNKVWGALTGCDFVGCNYWIKSMNCDWKKQEEFPVTHLRKSGNSYTRTIVTIDMIKKGFTKAIANNAMHCGKYIIADLEDYDACFAPVILQYAIFGEVIFG